jgi:hypothetical protein
MTTLDQCNYLQCMSLLFDTIEEDTGTEFLDKFFVDDNRTIKNMVDFSRAQYLGVVDAFERRWRNKGRVIADSILTGCSTHFNRLVIRKSKYLNLPEEDQDVVKRLVMSAMNNKVTKTEIDICNILDGVASFCNGLTS